MMVQSTNFNLICIDECQKSLDSASTLPNCYAVYTNNQGPKNGQCPFFHTYLESGQLEEKRGQIIQLQCQVKFHFFIPTLVDEAPSTNQMAIISQGIHTHPPPPPHRVPPKVRDRIITLVKEFGVCEATARKLTASPMLSIMLNGKTSLGQEHVALTNQDVVNYLIRKERAKEFPWGTDFQGVQYLMRQQSGPSPYIHWTELFTVKFKSLCQKR